MIYYRKFNFIKRPHTNNRGFTLIEIMIALGLLAVSLISLNSLQSYSVFRAAESERLTVATMLARKKMAETEIELRNIDFSEVKKEDAGEFELYPGFTWERRIDEFIFNIPLPKQEDESSIGVELTTEVIAQKLSEIISKHVMQVTLFVNYTVMGRNRQLRIITHIVDLMKDVELTL